MGHIGRKGAFWGEVAELAAATDQADEGPGYIVQNMVHLRWTDAYLSTACTKKKTLGSGVIVEDPRADGVLEGKQSFWGEAAELAVLPAGREYGSCLAEHSRRDIIKASSLRKRCRNCF